MKKFLALLLAALMVFTLVACGTSEEAPADTSKPADTTQPVTPEKPDAEVPSDEVSFEGRSISIAMAGDDNVNSFQAQIDAFCEKYGCEVDVELLSGDANENTNTLFLRAATGALPDLFITSVGAVTENLDPENNLYDLSGQPFLANIADAYLDVVTSDQGAVWAVPSQPSNVAGVFYNKVVFEELGLELPTTWEEFLASCQWIRENTEMDPVCNPFDGSAGRQILYLSQYYYIREENENFADQYTAREINLHESPALMRGLQKLYDINEYGYQNSDPLSTSLEDCARALCEGTAAYVICRTNIMASVELVAPDQYNDIGFFPLPDEGTQGVAVWMPTGWYMSKNTEDVELALKFLEFLTTKEAVAAYCSVKIPTGAFMLNGIEMPDNVSSAVQESQVWVEKASTPVMEYFCNIKGRNMNEILAMCGTGELTPDEAVEMLEADFQLNAEQNGIW